VYFGNDSFGSITSPYIHTTINLYCRVSLKLLTLHPIGRGVLRSGIRMIIEYGGGDILMTEPAFYPAKLCPAIKGYCSSGSPLKHCSVIVLH